MIKTDDLSETQAAFITRLMLGVGNSLANIVSLGFDEIHIDTIIDKMMAETYYKVSLCFNISHPITKQKELHSFAEFKFAGLAYADLLCLFLFSGEGGYIDIPVLLDGKSINEVCVKEYVSQLNLLDIAPTTVGVH